MVCFKKKNCGAYQTDSPRDGDGGNQVNISLDSIEVVDEHQTDSPPAGGNHTDGPVQESTRTSPRRQTTNAVFRDGVEGSSDTNEVVMCKLTSFTSAVQDNGDQESGGHTESGTQPKVISSLIDMII